MALFPYLLAFLGGVFGSLVGGTLAFIISGILALAGAFLWYQTGDDFLLNQIAFGPFFGPQTAFVGGVAAAAWLGKHSPHEAGNDVMQPLAETLPIRGYLVGGLFGVLGYMTALFFQHNSLLPVDSGATAVLICALLTRFLVTRSGISTKTYGGKKFFRTCYERFKMQTFWTLVISLATALLCIKIGIPSIGWGLSAITLLLNYGTKVVIPATHHITMIVGYTAVRTQDLLLALGAGLVALFLGILLDTATRDDLPSHIDMPATVISFLSFPIFMWG